MKRRIMAFSVLAITLAAAGASLAAPPSPVFVKTHDSDDWVTRTFDIQSHYPRVLVVTAGEAPKQVSVVSLQLNDFPSAAMAGEAEARVPDAVFATLQEAADAAKGGDLVLVMPGVYAGFAIGDKPDAGDGAYIHFKAVGDPGEVTIDRTAPGKDPNWMILIQSAHHVIVEGFNIAGATGPGLEPKGPRAGIFIDGNFGPTGKMTHHIVILNNFSHNHRSWGLHSTDSHTVLMQGNLFALSCQEHSAYVSDGSDNYCIRRNVFFASRSSGLQCNLDPDASLNELSSNAAFTGYPPVRPTRQWAQGLLELATEKFGENNFPDGKGVNFIIENNVVNGNGQGGGGSFNFAGLQDSLIQNNLVYANFTTGIAEWDNANSFDRDFVSPEDPADVKGPESVSYWGCQRNLIRNNTVVMNTSGRVAMLLNNGSWGNRLRNNIFVNDPSDSMEVTNTSILKLDSGYNVLRTINYNGMSEAFLALATNLDAGNHSMAEVNREELAAEVADMNDDPWVIIEGNWWRLNPERPDFRPKAGSQMLVGTGDPEEMPALDLGGRSRSGADIGAYCPASEM